VFGINPTLQLSNFGYFLSKGNFIYEYDSLTF